MSNNELILNNTDIINLYWMNKDSLGIDAIEITTDLNAFSDIDYAMDEAEFQEVAEFGRKWIISNEDGQVKFIEYDKVTGVRLQLRHGEYKKVINKDRCLNYRD